MPQSFEELQRIANTVIAGGLAPAGLIRRLKDHASQEEAALWRAQNLAAVSGVLMAGAELGLPPMAALRMMTSINGRPVLYGGGNVAIVRRRRGDDGKADSQIAAHRLHRSPRLEMPMLRQDRAEARPDRHAYGRSSPRRGHADRGPD